MGPRAAGGRRGFGGPGSRDRGGCVSRGSGAPDRSSALIVVRLVASPEAEADVDEILDWLEREAGKPVALKYAERFQDGFVRLMTFPEIGARRRRLHADMRIRVAAP